MVATPIGNLEDITLRAIRILREVQLIAAEDTRHSGRLLKHYSIDTKMVSFHEHSNASRQTGVLGALETGDVALISDAGTPAMSDPGFPLVQAAIERGHRVSPIPGPAAAVAAVTVSGLVPDGFLFLGFLPRKQKERRHTLRGLRDIPFPLVIHEAPHRLRRCLADIETELGDRPLAIARELTKLHEEIIHTTVAAARAKYEEERARGEFVIVIGLPVTVEAAIEFDAPEVLELLADRIQAGDSPSAAARYVASRTGLPRSELYRRTHEINRIRSTDTHN